MLAALTNCAFALRRTGLGFTWEVALILLGTVLLLRPFWRWLPSFSRWPEHAPPIGAMAGALLGRMSYLPAISTISTSSWSGILVCVFAILAVRILVRTIPPT